MKDAYYFYVKSKKNKTECLGFIMACLKQKLVPVKQSQVYQLIEEFEKYPDLEFPDLPEHGNLKLEEVKDAPYFFQ